MVAMFDYCYLYHLISIFVMNLVCKNNIEFSNFRVDNVGSGKGSPPQKYHVWGVSHWLKQGLVVESAAAVSHSFSFVK